MTVTIVIKTTHRYCETAIASLAAYLRWLGENRDGVDGIIFWRLEQKAGLGGPCSLFLIGEEGVVALAVICQQ